MPKIRFTDEERREVTLAAIQATNMAALSREYGVSRAYAYDLREEALKNAEAELEFWQKVVELKSS